MLNEQAFWYPKRITLSGFKQSHQDDYSVKRDGTDMEIHSVLLEALPPTVHRHLSAHTHTQAHTIAWQRKREIKSSKSSQHTPVQQQYRQTHLLGQGSQWNVVEESRRGEESNNISSEQWMVNTAEKRDGSQLKARKPFASSALWMDMQFGCTLRCNTFAYLNEWG